MSCNSIFSLIMSHPHQKHSHCQHMLVVGSYSLSVNISSRLKSLLSQSFVFEFLWPPVREKSHFRPNRMLYCSVLVCERDATQDRLFVVISGLLQVRGWPSIHPLVHLFVFVAKRLWEGKKDKRGARVTSVLLEGKECVEWGELWDQWESSFHKRLICARLYDESKRRAPVIRLVCSWACCFGCQCIHLTSLCMQGNKLALLVVQTLVKSMSTVTVKLELQRYRWAVRLVALYQKYCGQAQHNIQSKKFKKYIQSLLVKLSQKW